MNGPLPVTVLCGYLGAGKTTQLNHLLRHADRRIAVMVNDFGAVQIDADLIAGASGDVLRLTNGCVCCAMDGDLVRSFDRILALRDRIDHLVIEASGVAEPQRLSTLARAEPDLRLAGVVTVLCAATGLARLSDPRIARAVQAQIAGADALILTREGIAGADAADRVRLAAEGLAPHAIWAPAFLPALLNLPARTAVPRQAPPSNHFRSFQTAVAELPAPVDAAALRAWFAAAPSTLHRAKGFVRLVGAAHAVLVQFASGTLEMTPCTGDRAGRIVMIGVDADVAALAGSLERLGAAPALR